MTINAVAPWFGSKRTLADRIVRELGRHRAYWDLCCGSLAVPLAKPPCEHEYLIDLHGDLINLVSVLIGDWSASALYAKLSRTICSEHLFLEAKRAINESEAEPPEQITDITAAHVDRAFWFMVFSWCGMSGFGGTDNKTGFAMRFTTGGGPQAVRFRSATDRIPDWHHRLRLTNPIRRDVREIIPRIEDAAGVVIYYDPPYLEEGGPYKHNLTMDDHREIASMLCEKEHARIVCSFYDHPELNTLFAGWTKVDCSMAKQLSLARRRAKPDEERVKPSEAPEVLMINGPSFTESERMLF